MMRYVIFLYFVFLSACGSMQKTDYYYNEIAVKNKSSSHITDVVIRVEKIQAVFSCSFIPAGADCSNSFRNRKYLGNSVQISWIQDKQKRNTKKFTLTVPEGFTSHDPMRGVLEVNDNGFYRTYFEQQPARKPTF